MKIVVLGAGGHSRSVCDLLLQRREHEIIGLLDPHEKNGFFSLPLLGGDELLEELYKNGKAQGVFAAVGSNQLRRKLTLYAVSLGYQLVFAVSPYAVISPFATIGKGTAIMAGAVVNAAARIGEGCILNTNCSVDHDDVIGDYCHIAPGATLCGTVTVGSGSMVGAGAKVIDRIAVGENVIIGAGAVVIRDIPANHTAVGVPAAIIK